MEQSLRQLPCVLVLEATPPCPRGDRHLQVARRLSTFEPYRPHTCQVTVPTRPQTSRALWCVTAAPSLLVLIVEPSTYQQFTHWNSESGSTSRNQHSWPVPATFQSTPRQQGMALAHSKPLSRRSEN